MVFNLLLFSFLLSLLCTASIYDLNESIAYQLLQTSDKITDFARVMKLHADNTVLYFVSSDALISSCIFVINAFKVHNFTIVFEKRPSKSASDYFEDIYDQIIKVASGIDPFDEKIRIEKAMICQAPLHFYDYLRRLNERSRDYFKNKSLNKPYVDSVLSHKMIKGTARISKCDFIVQDVESDIWYISALRFAYYIEALFPNIFKGPNNVAESSVLTIPFENQVMLPSDIFHRVLFLLFEIDPLSFSATRLVCRSWCRRDLAKIFLSEIERHVFSRFFSNYVGCHSKKMIDNCLNGKVIFAHLTDDAKKYFMANHAFYPVYFHPNLSSHVHDIERLRVLSIIDYYKDNLGLPIPYEYIEQMSPNSVLKIWSKDSIFDVLTDNGQLLCIRMVSDYPLVKEVWPRLLNLLVDLPECYDQVLINGMIGILEEYFLSNNLS